MGQVGRPRYNSGCSHNHEMTPAMSATYHYECPTCGAVSGKFSKSASLAELQSYHPHPTVSFSKFQYSDGHAHHFKTDLSGKVTEQRPESEQLARPVEMPYADIVRTHAISANPDPTRFASRKLGAPQVASILERHYKNTVIMRQHEDLIQKYSSGEVQPRIDVRWNDGNPVVTGGLTTLAMARKHFPNTPIGLNYID
jgi:hypothetical protein